MDTDPPYWPMSLAPTDGTVVLTDCGVARALSKGECTSWCVEEGSWAYCVPGGDVFDDSDYGVLRCSPTKWNYLPNWMK